MRKLSFVYISLIFLISCGRPETASNEGPVFLADKTEVETDSIGPGTENHLPEPDAPAIIHEPGDAAIITEPGDAAIINTKTVTPRELVSYAETLTGTPYRYASIDPRQGFDCSGFITYVFNHFKIAVPRSSVDFTNVKREIQLKDAKRGDIILFTGTDSTTRVVGHMGIITSNPGDELQFIHSTSGKAFGVTTTPLSSYYQGRFMKVLRIFKQNDRQ